MDEDLLLETLRTLGIAPEKVTDVQVLRRRPQHVVVRVACGDAHYVLKRFDTDTMPLEIRMYTLLPALGVPVLPVHGATERALLVEDLEHSAEWRPAEETDQDDPATGSAVAAWYRRLHDAGRRYLQEVKAATFLTPWTAKITKEALEQAGQALGISHEPAWQLALSRIGALQAALNRFPQTFNYDDFALENLALSRGSHVPRQAIVYDYDWFATGMAHSDWRNVCYSLRGAALAAFVEAYGPVSEQEKRLDEPLSILDALIIAARHPQLPSWARESLEAVRNGELARAIHAAPLVHE